MSENNLRKFIERLRNIISYKPPPLCFILELPKQVNGDLQDILVREKWYCITQHSYSTWIKAISGGKATEFTIWLHRRDTDKKRLWYVRSTNCMMAKDLVEKLMVKHKFKYRILDQKQQIH